jgi:hypothetical protein
VTTLPQFPTVICFSRVEVVLTLLKCRRDLYRVFASRRVSQCIVGLNSRFVLLCKGDVGRKCDGEHPVVLDIAHLNIVG